MYRSTCQEAAVQGSMPLRRPSEGPRDKALPSLWQVEGKPFLPQHAYQTQLLACGLWCSGRRGLGGGRGRRWGRGWGSGRRRRGSLVAGEGGDELLEGLC